MRSNIPNKDEIKVKLFAMLRESVGKSEITMAVPSGFTVRDLTNEVLKKYPQLKPFSNKFVTAVNCKVTNDNTIITSNDEIALLPPVSGG